MPDYQNWLLSVDDRVATLTLNRPEKLNSLTPDTLHELRDAAHYLGSQPEVWTVVLAGAGQHFSVGVDVNVIGSLRGQAPDDFRDTLLDLQDCLDTFEKLDKPKIARLQGYSLGGGFLLALCCDFRIASAEATFGFPEVKRGIAVVMGTQRITRLVGPAVAREVVLLAENFDAQTALGYGFVNRVVAPDDLDAATDALADKFRRLPPRTVSIARQIIDEGASMTLRESQELEIALQAQLLDSPDFDEGVRSFFEKREPRFRGE